MPPLSIVSRQAAIATLLVGLWSVSGCSSSEDPDTPTPQLVSKREVDPLATDPSLSPVLFANGTANVHYAVTPGSNARGKLLVFIGGTNSRPVNLKRFVDLAGDLGYHAINVAYPNTVPVTECSTTNDPDCAEKFRREVLLGEATSSLVAVNATNSLRARILKLIQYLQNTYPAENWGQFLQSGDVNWGAVTTAGHSQGAGHAAYFGLLFSLDRVIMFSGPQDYDYVTNQVAPWVLQAKATAGSRYVSFLHALDESPGDAFAKQVESGQALSGTNLGAFQVDNAAAPFANRQILFTQAVPNQPSGLVISPYHNCTVVDAYVPLVNGTPQFESVWRYLLLGQ